MLNLLSLTNTFKSWYTPSFQPSEKHKTKRHTVEMKEHSHSQKAQNVLTLFQPALKNAKEGNPTTLRGERGLRKHSPHFIRHVLDMCNSFAELRTICRHPLEKKVWTWQPNTVESTYPRCRPIYDRKAFLGCCPRSHRFLILHFGICQ